MIATTGMLGQVASGRAKKWRVKDSAGQSAVRKAEIPTQDLAMEDAGSAGGAASAWKWPELIDRIRNGQEAASEELYRLFVRGIRFYLWRQLGPQELDDKVHDTFIIVLEAIRRGDIREPERLMGFVRTVVRRQVARYIDQVVHERRELLHLDVGVPVPDNHRNPEQTAALQEKVDMMVDVLRKMTDRDREILTRFYLDEQSQDEICAEMNLTETQFRLLKSRAKARFGELGKRQAQQKKLVSVLMRTFSAAAH